MRLFLLTFLIIFFRFAVLAQAAVIFTDNFQNGQANGWQAAGEGDVRLSNYKGNISLFLSRRAAVITEFSTKGYGAITVSLSFAAKSLEKGEYCIGEVSGDGGNIWHQVNRVGDGQDDAVTLHSGSVSSASLGNRERVYLRVRVTGNSANDSCWLDNVRVTGRKILAVQNNYQIFSSAQLRAGKPFDHPVDMSFFAPSKDALAPIYHFNGRLDFTGKVGAGGGRILKDSFHYGAGKAASLPDFAIDFISFKNEIIPVRRGLIVTGHPQWDIILEPGRIWNEVGEKSFSRAAIPFSLQEKNANCTHNGVMTFLFNADSIISRVAVEISSETCLYFKFDIWGFHKAEYIPGPVRDSLKIIAAYRQEKSSRLPVRPISDLAKDYPGINPDNFGAPKEVSPKDMTAFGLLVDGIHYVGGCDSRYGPYPYCDVLDLPSYSTAKSLFGGLALLRMEKLYPGIRDEKIADYVPACKKAGSWGDVSFQNALNMATGHYDSDKYMVDEASGRMIRFFDAESHQDKIKAACDGFKRKIGPGKKWVYHTSDSYILGTALQNYLKEKKGMGADIYRDILGPLWRKLDVSPVLNTTRRTSDHRAQPFTGYGLTFHRDDIVKIAEFLNSGQTEFFDNAEFRKALQHDKNDRGLAAYGKDIKYKNGFWASNFQKSLGCQHPVWIPFMSGYGGITVAMLPHDIIYYYFSDNDDFVWKQAVVEAGKIKNFCK